MFVANTQVLVSPSIVRNHSRKREQARRDIGTKFLYIPLEGVTYANGRK